MDRPDILIFFSDQHNPAFTGLYGNEIVKTPNIDLIGEKGCVFDAAYTSCPLCVPARVSMLTGQLPSKTGIFTNQGAIAQDQATYIHSIAAQGYETVLCGRMHFVGDDQRHGFTKRIMGDITPLYWGREGKERKDLGPYAQTLGMYHCLDIIGGGTSPVLEYDKAVIEAAIDYLQQDHDRPQCIVIGTYAPHFPYVCPPDLYRYYREIVELPVSLGRELNYTHPVIRKKEQPVDEDTLLSARAAYCGMITNLDRQIRMVRDAWEDYLNRNKKQGIFIYLSDHGDQVGERYLFGKQTFYEGSSRIPLIFEGSGIKAGYRFKSPVSIMDVGETLTEILGAKTLPARDGKSLVPQIYKAMEDQDRFVISEYVEMLNGERIIPGRMVRKGKWKLISYACDEQEDLLFDLQEDPDELHNLATENTEIARELKGLLTNNWDVDNIARVYALKQKHYEILRGWGKTVEVEERERWQVTEEALQLPTVK